MVDEALSGAQKALEFAYSHPAAFAVPLGPAAAWVLGLILERYFMPIAETREHRRHQQGALLIGVWLLGGGVATGLWWAFSVPLPLAEGAVISYSLALPLTFAYPIIGKLATDWKPAIGSAWRREDAGP